jgi:hypothetical protein
MKKTIKSKLKQQFLMPPELVVVRTSVNRGQPIPQ